jgi:hypothetical protein
VNARKKDKFLTLIIRCLSEGPAAIKDFAHEARTHALTKQSNETAAKKEFLASTVARAVWWDVSEAKQSLSSEQAKERWTTIREVDTSVLKALEHYIDKVLPLPTVEKGDEPYPLPSQSACYSTPQAKGGTAAALQERYTAWLCSDLEGLLCGDRPFVRQTWAGVTVGTIPDDEIVGAFERFDILADITEGKPHLPPENLIRNWCLEGQCQMRPVTLVEAGGKIRTVTLHRAEDAQCARLLTGLWLKALRGMVVTRDVLKGKPVVLGRKSRGDLLYSADLTAATDFMPHSLAQLIATKLCLRLGRPEDIPIARKLLGPQQLPDGTTTTNGVHMGLGCSWPILCIANSFAAWHAGADRDSYRICGDDLIGYWSPQIADRYERILGQLGLEANKSKSFRGRRGVFCETLVTPRENGTAISSDVGKIGMLTASRLKGGQGHSTFATAAGIQSARNDWTGIGKKTARSLLPGNAPGKVSSFGNGSKPSMGTLNRLLRHGRTDFNKRKDPLPDEVKRQIAESATPNGEVSVDDFLICLAAARDLKARLYGRPLPKPKGLTRSEFMAGVKENRRLNKNTTTASLLHQVQQSSLNSGNKKLARLLLLKPKFLRVKNPLSRLENVLSRGNRMERMPIATCERLILDQTGLEWGGRLRRLRDLAKALREGRGTRLAYRGQAGGEH